MKYNKYFANHFASCVLLAHTRDLSRNRPVKIYMLPDFEENIVGITDGVDAWISTADDSVMGVNARRLLLAARSQATPPTVFYTRQLAPHPTSARRKIAEPPVSLPPPARRRVIVESPPPAAAVITPRRRITIPL